MVIYITVVATDIADTFVQYHLNIVAVPPIEHVVVIGRRHQGLVQGIDTSFAPVGSVTGTQTFELEVKANAATCWHVIVHPSIGGCVEPVHWVAKQWVFVGVVLVYFDFTRGNNSQLVVDYVETIGADLHVNTGWYGKIH